MKNLNVFPILLLVRIASVLLVQTWYVPDEYWQSLEVAHDMVFGYGYLTWEWTSGLRSYVYPLLIAVVYKLLQILSFDNIFTLTTLPRFFQALLSAYSDLCFYRWSGFSKWALFGITTSYFWFYTCSRTLINTLEMSLTTIALSRFPWKGGEDNFDKTYLWLVAIICAIRPTAAIPWLPLSIYHILNSENKLKLLLLAYLPIGVTTLITTISLDSLCHGKFVITVWQFLKANVLLGVGEWYGTQPWHWYLSTGLPALLGIHFVPFIISAGRVLRFRHNQPKNLILLGTIVFTVTIYSFLPHKEFRFILSILPMALYVSSDVLSHWSRKASSVFIWFVTVTLLVGNLVPAWYLSMVHQRGTLDVMIPLRKISASNPHNTSLLFLMPCHSTPLYSHIHVNVSTRFLTCEPNLSGTKGYVDEADQFYKRPVGWLRDRYPPNGSLPSHIICFDVLVPSITDILSRYKLINGFFHTDVAIGRVGQNVFIYERYD